MRRPPDRTPTARVPPFNQPFTLEMIEATGAAWLTQALHAAGTLPVDNTVTAMKVTPFVTGSMSLKCFLDVTYAKRS